jgi:hypothetical protein
VEPTPTQIVTNVQDIVLQIISVTLEKEIIGENIHESRQHSKLAILIFSSQDLFDAMFTLVDVFTFTLRVITPSMWLVFESMHRLFKSVAIDYLDGECHNDLDVPTQ